MICHYVCWDVNPSRGWNFSSLVFKTLMSMWFILHYFPVMNEKHFAVASAQGEDMRLCVFRPKLALLPKTFQASAYWLLQVGCWWVVIV